MRPSLSQWRETLQQAIDQTLDCQHCRHQFFYHKEHEIQVCPFCNKQASPDSFIIFEVLVEIDDDNNAQYHPLNNIRILNQDANISFSSAPYCTELWNQADNLLDIKWGEDKLQLLPINNSTFRINNSQKGSDFTTRKTLPLAKITPESAYYFSMWKPSEIEDDQHLKLIQSYRWGIRKT